MITADRWAPNFSGVLVGKSFQPTSGVNESIEWYTPPEIFTALNCTFDLDPASPGLDHCAVPARKCYTYKDNGLALPWEGLVWMNPPYGSNTRKWMLKLLRHGNGMALVFARTDNEWFQYICSQATMVCFMSERIRFIDSAGRQAGSPSSGSMLVCFGDVAAQIAEKSGLGVCFRPVRYCHVCKAPGVGGHMSWDDLLDEPFCCDRHAQGQSRHCYVPDFR